MWTAERLIAFEQRVADAFAAKQIRAPIHLCSEGQAEPLIEVFQQIRPQDWIFLGWRNHFHCLLKGMPEEELFQHILEGRSMFVMSEKYRIVSSAIVGGVLPIAAGLAMGIKRNGKSSRVWTFVGDMTATTGVFSEFKRYCDGHELPVSIVVEDNGLSTGTPTNAAWGFGDPHGGMIDSEIYNYHPTWPHTGIGTHVSF